MITNPFVTPLLPLMFRLGPKIPLYRFRMLLIGLILFVVLLLAFTRMQEGQINLELIGQYLFNYKTLTVLMLSEFTAMLIGFQHEKNLLQEYEIKSMIKKLQEQKSIISGDIEVQKIRQKELEDAKQEAVMNIKAKDQFLSNMSHEIRTPMNGIIGIINLLKETKLDDEQRNYLSTIDYSSQNLLTLINQILDLSKINCEKLTLEYIDFDLHKILYSVAPTFQGIISEKGIILRTVVDPNVPKWVSGDPVRLNQILLNLVSNAIKFTEQGGVDIIVKASQTDDGPRLHIQVNDTGIGIPKDKHDQVFESFTQASTDTSRLYGGSGLGLTICRKLVELYGGTIKLESQVGKGSSFSFEVQLKEVKVPQNHANNVSTSDPFDGELDPKKVKILIAEDNKANQLVISHTLKKRGFNITIVPNGQEVIESVYKEEFDIILMDVQMPIMDGLDATRFIRNATSKPLCDIKIIAMTASVMKEDIDKCLAAGMNDYVSKPFNPQDLFHKLRTNLSAADV